MFKTYSPYMDIKEFASYTKGTVRWAYSLTSQRQVPFIKAKGKILFHKGTVDAWLLEQSMPTISAIKKDQMNKITNVKNSNYGNK